MRERDGAGGHLQLLEGWGRRPRSAARVQPFDDAAPRPAPRGVLARGLGRSYGDAALNAGGTVYDMTVRSRVSTFDAAAGTVTVDAGISLHRLMRALLPLGWFVAVTPGTRYVTVGGAIAADIHGKNHHVDGSFCDHVVSLELRTAGGDTLTLAPNLDPDGFWATAGGMGLTGVITRATLRLLPVQTGHMRVDSERTRDLDDLLDRMHRGDEQYRYSVAWIDLLARGRTLGRSVLTRGDHARLDELPRRRDEPDAPAMATRLAVPDLVPPGLLNRWSIRAFNAAWYRKSRDRTGHLASIPAFFHPLDAIGGWNRLYGPQGFVQYQFVVPFGTEETLRTVVGRLSAARVPSFLAVLKRFGPGHGFLSFPMPGWTLALDIPAGVSGLPALLDGLDELVAAAGGRVYLAKDARLRPDVFRAMYPQLPRWQAVRNRLDPQHGVQSDLARRLQLIGNETRGS